MLSQTNTSVLSECDWLVPVDECIGECKVVSPGYPGIYPPQTRCHYLFSNFDDSRVELKLGAGSGFSGKFDMKKRYMQMAAIFYKRTINHPRSDNVLYIYFEFLWCR